MFDFSEFFSFTNILVLAKYTLIIFIAGYAVFSLLVIRQVFLLEITLKTKGSFFLRIIAFLNMALALFVLFLALGLSVI